MGLTGRTRVLGGRRSSALAAAGVSLGGSFGTTTVISGLSGTFSIGRTVPVGNEGRLWALNGGCSALAGRPWPAVPFPAVGPKCRRLRSRPVTGPPAVPARWQGARPAVGAGSPSVRPVARPLVRQFEQQLKLATASQQSLLDRIHPLEERFGSPMDGAFFERAREEFTGNLQLTQPRGYRAGSMESALQWAYVTYVEEPSGGPRPINYQAIAPYQLRSRLWGAFERRGLVGPRRVRRQPVFTGRHAAWTFDLSYKNGKLNLISSLALNATAVETNLGRALVLKGMVDDVSAKESAHGVAVIQARQDAEAPGVAEARSILADADIEVVDVHDLLNLVDKVERELAPTGGKNR